VRRFILGDAALQVSRKFYGDDPLVDRAIVTLMGHRGAGCWWASRVRPSRCCPNCWPRPSAATPRWRYRARPAPLKTISSIRGTMLCCWPKAEPARTGAVALVPGHGGGQAGALRGNHALCARDAGRAHFTDVGEAADDSGTGRRCARACAARLQYHRQRQLARPRRA